MRPQLVDAVLKATSRIVAQGAMFSQLIAERLGLAATDVECLEMLAESGRVSAGRLAELTGLTTGAATRMIDRLEQGGFVRRVADVADRRKVLVEAVPERVRAIGPFYASLSRATEAMVARYGDVDLAMIVDYLERSVDVTRDEITRLRAPAIDNETVGASHAAPLGPTEAGRLLILSGAPFVDVHGDGNLGGDLYRARFDGPVPRVRSRGGTVTVHYGRLFWLDWRARVVGQNLQASVHWRRDRAEFALSTSVPWAIELRGGVSKLSADLRSVALELFEMRGGASKVEITLGQPRGIVPVRVGGGLSHLTVHRPAGVPVRLSVRDAGRVLLDEHLVGRGSVTAETQGAGLAEARFEVESTGGASRVVVDVR